MTRVSVVSDLHLEFADISLPGGDVLILAGDIWTVRHMRTTATDADGRAKRKRYDRFCAEELAKYGRALLITGNHEPYSDVIDEMDGVLRNYLATRAPNTRLLANETEIIDGVAFLGTPLWATCGVGDPRLEVVIGGGMNDFRLIRTIQAPPAGFDPEFVGIHRRFTPRDAHRLHEEAVAWLRSELPKHKVCVVIAHHAPSMRSANGYRYGTEDLDLGYCSDLEDLITQHPQIAVAIHGHTHKRECYHVGMTQIVANPRGYWPDEKVSRDFDPAAADFEIAEICPKIVARPLAARAL